MTLREKVGQLNQRLYGFECVLRDGDALTLSEGFQREARRFGGIGVLYGLYRADPWSGRTWENGLHGPLAVRAYNLAQRFVLTHSRLGVPMLISSECPHGHQALGGYLLPVNLAAGAAFNPGLLREAASVCGRQLRELGVNLALVSMLDLLRDPRWGRCEECFSEDPFLASRLASAAVEGFQSQGVAVVAKHFCAQGETTGGLNASAARIGPRELREIHLPPVQAACEAGVKGIMAAYNEIDGIPCHCNEALLTGLLREEYGFRGVVMADGFAVDRLDGVTGGGVRSGAAALRAGVDISLWDRGFSRLEEAVGQGAVSEEEIDRAVVRVLTLKFEQGLFEAPYLPEDRAPSRFHREAFPQSLELSRQSLVLLKNDGALPLRSPRSIALIGPASDDIYRQLGDYTPPVRAGEYATLLDGLARLCAEADPPVRLQRCDGGDLDLAQAMAAGADATVLALGGSSSRFGGASFDVNGAALDAAPGMDCGEGADCARLRLPGGQQELFARVRAASRLLATVLMIGRPYAVDEIAKGSDALLCCFYPGPWGGQAIAEALFGRFSPSGRLPVSFPSHAGQLPVCYNRKADVSPRAYRDLPGKPLFSFGEGMGYSSPRYSRFAFRPLKLPGGALPVNETPVAKLTMRVSNEGAYAESAVPMLFVTDLEADVVGREAELKAFEKVEIPAGESREVTLVLHARDLAVWNRRMERELQRGGFRLRLLDGGSLKWETVWTL